MTLVSLKKIKMTLVILRTLGFVGGLHVTAYLPIKARERSGKRSHHILIQERHLRTSNQYQENVFKR